jgi:hypothetical protein
VARCASCRPRPAQRERYERAEEHCVKALAIEKDNVKALFRRGRARVGRRNLDGAKEDFDRRARDTHVCSACALAC